MIAVPLGAQVTGATIQGIVTDQQNAAIPQVEVVVTNQATGVTSTTKTNATGLYEFPELIPGTYNLSAKASGFSVYTHKDIQVALQQRLRLDISMQVAAVSESIVVTGTPTVLDTDTAKISHLVSGTLVSEVPQNGRTSYMSTRLVAGGNPNAAAESYVSPLFSGNATAISFNGTAPQGNAVLMDGVSVQFGNGLIGYIVSNEAVQEMQIQSFALSAEYAQSGGSVTTTETKSGTNKPHGALWYYNTNSGFQANAFFNNKYGSVKPKSNNNQWGGNLGGPVYIPGVYNGKNRTFFFTNYEWSREMYYWLNVGSVPTSQERAGDFSNTLTSDGQLIQVYNPYTSRYNAAGVLVRDPLPGNQIPSSMLNPVAQNYFSPSLMPLPNQPGSFNNSVIPGLAICKDINAMGRLDHRLTSKDTLFLSMAEHVDNQDSIGSITKLADGSYGEDDKVASLGYTHVFGPTTILNVRSGASRNTPYWSPDAPPGVGARLGFASSFASLLRSGDPPIINIDDSTGVYNPLGRWHSFSWSAQPSLKKIAGRHSLGFGYEFRVFRNNNRNANGEAGTFNFLRDWTQGPEASNVSATSGYGPATMLLGTISSGSVSVAADEATQSVYHGLYVQDDWRVTGKLTLNVGLRYDYETPFTERYNRMNRGFDFTVASPIAQQAMANYTLNPIPEIPASEFQVRGGLRFAGVGGQSRYNADPIYANFLPRVGAAYQIASKTVVRAGYGLFYQPLRQIEGSYATEQNNVITQSGFSADTEMQTALNGLPLNTLTNPLPGGLVQPAGSSLGLSTLLGQPVTAIDTAFQRGRVHQFQFSVQRQLPWQTLLDVAYVGSRASKLQVDQNMNAYPNQYLALKDGLSQAVPNPFYGIIQQGTLSAPTVAKSQLLRPYPEFTGITESLRPIGSSWYNSLQATADKRLAQGLTFLASYTWSNSMQRLGFLNDNQPLEQVITPIDRPQRMVVSGVWDLPVGRGQKFGSGMPKAASYVLGNWTFSWVATFQSGQPVSGWARAIVVGTPKSIDKTIDKWFDTSAFAVQPAYTLRTTSSRFTGIRADDTKNFDLTLGKNFPIKESIRFRFMAQFYNAFNTPQFRAPNATVTSAAFGRVTGQANKPRWIWLSGKLEF